MKCSAGRLARRRTSFLLRSCPAIRGWLIIDVNPKAGGGHGGSADRATISLEMPTPPVVEFGDAPALAELGCAIGVGIRAR